MADEPQTPKTAYDALGGRTAIRRIVERFYDLMDQEPAFAELRALHAADLSPMRESLTGFLAGWSGGPRDWFENNPGKCMMSAHRNIPVDPHTARQWADAMRRAIADCPPDDPDVGSAMADVLENLAQGMIRS
jgi:hemoglobin